MTCHDTHLVEQREDEQDGDQRARDEADAARERRDERRREAADEGVGRRVAQREPPLEDVRQLVELAERPERQRACEEGGGGGGTRTFGLVPPAAASPVSTMAPPVGRQAGMSKPARVVCVTGGYHLPHWRGPGEREGRERRHIWFSPAAHCEHDAAHPLGVRRVSKQHVGSRDHRGSASSSATHDNT